LERRRPTGVTIIAVLAIIAGALLLFGGISLVALAPFIGQIKVNDDTNTSNTSLSLNVNGTVVTIPNNPLFVMGGFIGRNTWSYVNCPWNCKLCSCVGSIEGKGMGVDSYYCN